MSAQTASIAIERRPPRRATWRTALLRGRGLVGTIPILLVVLAAILAPVIAPFGPTQQIPGADLLPPGGEHLLGTDEVSRDVFSRLLYAIRIDLIVVFIAVPLGAAIGSLIGLVATTWSIADIVAQRVFDVILAFPVLILAIAMATVIGPGVVSIAAVIVAAEIPVFGRLIRTSVLKVRELPYVEASRVVGAGRWWALRKHVLPNSAESLLVQLSVSMSIAVILEGAMSFLGIGIVPPTPSLGSLIFEGMRNIYVAHYQIIGPLVVIVMLVLGFLLVSQALTKVQRG